MKSRGWGLSKCADGHHEDGDGRWSHAVNAGCLAQGCRADPVELFPDFIGQAVGRIKGKFRRNFYSLQILKFFNFIILTPDIPFVFNFNFHLPGCAVLDRLRGREICFKRS